MDTHRPSRVPDDLAAQFQYTIEMSQESIFWLERNGQFSYVNDQACRSLGYTRDELLSLFLWDVDPDFPKERWSNHWENLKKTGKFFIKSYNKTLWLIGSWILDKNFAVWGIEYNVL